MAPSKLLGGHERADGVGVGHKVCLHRRSQFVEIQGFNPPVVVGDNVDVEVSDVPGGGVRKRGGDGRDVDVKVLRLFVSGAEAEAVNPQHEPGELPGFQVVKIRMIRRARHVQRGVVAELVTLELLGGAVETLVVNVQSLVDMKGFLLHRVQVHARGRDRFLVWHCFLPHSFLGRHSVHIFRVHQRPAGESASDFSGWPSVDCRQRRAAGE